MDVLSQNESQMSACRQNIENFGEKLTQGGNVNEEDWEDHRNDISTIEDIWDERCRSLIRENESWIAKHQSLNDQFSKLNKQHEQTLDKLKAQRVISNKLPIVRQALLELFGQMAQWKTFPNWEAVAQKHSKPKHVFEKSDGAKLALFILDKQCSDLPTPLAEIYFKINKGYHPKTKPFKLIKEALTGLQEAIKLNGSSIQLATTELTRDELDLVGQCLDKQKYIFA
jgi:hypothetical protein